MKSTFLKLIIILFTVTITSCKKDESASLKDILVNNIWKQKIGIWDDFNYGQTKMFYEFNFQVDGYCTIVHDKAFHQYPYSPILDTVHIKYFIQNNNLLFPEPYCETEINYPGETSTVMENMFFNDWSINMLNNNIIHLIRKESQDKDGIVWGIEEVYIEPIN